MAGSPLVDILEDRPFRAVWFSREMSMHGFSLPSTQAINQADFRNAESASKWLAAQPQANVAAMLASLVKQVDAFNRYDVSARERFKTMEALRKAIFAVNSDCRRRFENKPLPLAPGELSVLDSVRRLWRLCAIAYQHCLKSCMDGDASLSAHSARVAHRVMFCLRLEQLDSYAAAVEPGPGFWRNLHAVLEAAEKLGVAGEQVSDRLLGETSESTVTGQYAMALLLHLAQPPSLSAGQFAALVRWLSRWREQAVVVDRPGRDARSISIPLDLSADQPVHLSADTPGNPRWLSLDGVLRKMRRRIESLAAGESPESLKLGSGLSAEACRALLESLAYRLQHPLPKLDLTDSMSLLGIGSGLVNIYRLLGGEGLEDPLHPASSADNHLSREQLAVFGHVVRERLAPPEAILESWRLGRDDGDELVLLRAADAATSRLSLRGMVALRRQDGYKLAVINSLGQRADGVLQACIGLLPGDVVPCVAEIRDRTSGKSVRHPVFLLSVRDSDEQSLLMPAGMMARATTVRFFDGRGQSLPKLRLVDCVERGSEIEYWRVLCDN